MFCWQWPNVLQMEKHFQKMQKNLLKHFHCLKTQFCLWNVNVSHFPTMKTHLHHWFPENISSGFCFDACIALLQTVPFLRSEMVDHREANQMKSILSRAHKFFWNKVCFNFANDWDNHQSISNETHQTLQLCLHVSFLPFQNLVHTGWLGNLLQLFPATIWNMFLQFSGMFFVTWQLLCPFSHNSFSLQSMFLQCSPSGEKDGESIDSCLEQSQWVFNVNSVSKHQIFPFCCEISEKWDVCILQTVWVLVPANGCTLCESLIVHISWQTSLSSVCIFHCGWAHVVFWNWSCHCHFEMAESHHVLGPNNTTAYHSAEMH